MKLKEWAKKHVSDVPAVYLSLKDKRTPKSAKVVAALIVVYALSPIDLIPDFIPVLGYLDDAIIIPALVVLFIKLIPKELLLENREKAKDIWKEGKPKRWFFAIPFVLIWLLILWLIVKAIFF